MAKKKEKSFSEKVKQFKTDVDNSGYNSRQAFKDLVELVYGEVEQIRSEIPEVKKASKK